MFRTQCTVDLAYSIEGAGRFRINIYRERGAVAIAARRLDDRIRSLPELNLPEHLSDLVLLDGGLVLVTGPTGSGKTTTLATLVHEINCTRRAHIITIEDPVEYVHANEQSLVHQRELYTDVPSFSDAVRAALREDPDVLLVGEMRDVETARAAILAAETGHLVFSTLHTVDAVGALARLAGVFPATEQDSIRNQLSLVLKAVVAQRLLPSGAPVFRVPAVEVLRVTTAVAHTIRLGRFEQIYSLMEAGCLHGMQTFDHSLADLVAKRLLGKTDAGRLSRDPRGFERLLELRSKH